VAVLIVQDVTARKLTEAALQNSEERFRQVISSISDHIYVTDVTEEGRYINPYLSTHAAALTGYPLDNFIADWSFGPQP
jgi:PAS domain-containing protein